MLYTLSARCYTPNDLKVGSFSFQVQGTLSPVVAGSEPELSRLKPLNSRLKPLSSRSKPLISGANPPYNIRRKEDIIINKGGDDDFVGEVLEILGTEILGTPL